MSRFDFFDELAEERLELMLESGRKIMRDAIEKYKPVAIFGGFSGGNDSVVATHFACTEFGAAAIHCNTLIGIEMSHQHARDVAAYYGWHYLEKKAHPSGPPKKTRKGEPFDPKRLPTGKWTDGETAYEEWCFNFGMPGPGKHSRMYQRLKERSFNAFKRDAKVGKKRDDCVLFVMGIRNDESAIRAGYNEAVKKVGGSVYVNPFYFSGATDFEIYRQEFGLPRNKASAVVGISGECLCGTMGDPVEIDGISKLEPETGNYIRSLEDKTESLGLPCKWATRPDRRLGECQSDTLQLTLFGDAPEFQPACVGCHRRQTND